MGHLKDFILDKGHDYRVRKPASDTHLGNRHGDMHALALSTDNESFALGLSTKDFPGTCVKNLRPNSEYVYQWWHIEDGQWQTAVRIQSGASGKLNWPPVPDGSRNWAYRIRLKGYHQ